jgi:hypothetical protein
MYICFRKKKKIDHHKKKLKALYIKKVDSTKNLMEITFVY